MTGLFMNLLQLQNTYTRKQSRDVARKFYLTNKKLLRASPVKAVLLRRAARV